MVVNDVQSDLDWPALGGRLDRHGGRHLYLQISQLLKDEIQRGRLEPGMYLPPQRDLANTWGIGEVTVRRALQSMAEEGLIEARPGSGTVVCKLPDTPTIMLADSAVLNIGVAFDNLADGYPFFTPILEGLRSQNARVAIRMFDTQELGSTDSQTPYTATLAGYHGLVMMSPIHLGLLARCQERYLPTVLMFSDIADNHSHCILPDYTQGVMQAVKHLKETGRRRVALVTAGSDRFSTGRWIESFRAAADAFDLPIEKVRIVSAGYSENNGMRATRHLLNLPNKPDAILFASDHLARGGLLAAHAAGFQVPDQLAIIGAGPVLDGNGWTVPIATIDLGLKEMGATAFRMLASKMGDSASEPQRHVTTSRFQPGQTT